MELQMDKDLRFIFDVLPAFGTRYSNLVLAYCCLFGVTPFHIKAKKLRLILEEMKRLFDAQAFNYNKKLYPISHAGIAEALDICVKKNFESHLKNHNYLKEVMIGISERERKNQSRAAEKELRKKEDKLKAGYDRPETAPSPQSSPSRGEDKGEGETRPNAEEAKKNIQRIVNLVDNIGKKKK